jgi:hypothetical protein
MLPNNIDLTANRDFMGDFRGTVFSNLLLTRGYDDDPMTSEEYDAIAEHEKFFGRRLHLNERRRIFAKKFETTRGTCLRCGRRIAPWGGELCRDCNSAVEYRIPWNIPPMVWSTDRTTDVFDLR